MNRRTRGELCQVLEMHECDHKGKNLGLPYCNFKSKIKAFWEVEDRLASRFAGWKGRLLSDVFCS